MTKIEWMVDELSRAFDGEAWHGPAMMEVLEGVDAETAAERPISKGHTIWELVLHVAAWERVITRRILGESLTLTDEQNFGHIVSMTETAWREALTTLRANHAELIQTVSRLSDSALERTVPGKPYNIQFMLLGAVQHAAYHGGQMALLKRFRA